ncbi:MAG TPA: cytochrome c oxidase subunit II [Bryobacteraceae bacterium]|nr:cytochrome c oxidase subunit II [Bryobacteraceae bacterium]
MAIAILIAALAGATVALFFQPRWWFPDAISAHARAYDSQLVITLWVVGCIFVAAQAALAWVVFRYRDRGQQPSAAAGNNTLELLWTSATAVVFLALAFAGQGIWAGVHLAGPDPAALRIETLAKQFAWTYRYAGADGVFGRVDIRQIDDASGNPFGIDSRDPKGRDDITEALLRVPAGRPVELHLKSRDVIHNFFVRELRLKQDVVPGMTIPLRFTAETPGTYEVPCSELCGLGHHQMRSSLVVLPPAEFDEWMREAQQKVAQP